MRDQNLGQCTWETHVYVHRFASPWSNDCIRASAKIASISAASMASLIDLAAARTIEPTKKIRAVQECGPPSTKLTRSPNSSRRSRCHDRRGTLARPTARHQSAYCCSVPEQDARQCTTSTSPRPQSGQVAKHRGNSPASKFFKGHHPETRIAAQAQYSCGLAAPQSISMRGEGHGDGESWKVAYGHADVSAATANAVSS